MAIFSDRFVFAISFLIRALLKNGFFCSIADILRFCLVPDAIISLHHYIVKNLCFLFGRYFAFQAMVFSKQEKAQCVEWFIEEGKSIAKFGRRYRGEVGRNAKPPSKNLPGRRNIAWTSPEGAQRKNTMTNFRNFIDFLLICFH